MRSEGQLARLAEVAARARPVALAREHVLPVLDALHPLLPDGIRRGSTVGVTGTSTSLALALIAGSVQAGSWVAVTGVSTLGLAAASELGVGLDRTVFVADPPVASWGAAVAALVDSFDVALVRPPRRASPTDARRLAARARERGSVLVVLGGERTWPEAPDIRLSLTRAEWVGLGDGHGHLQARRVTVEVDGRRGAARPRRAELWLPGPDGAVAPCEPLASVHPLRSPAAGGRSPS